MTKKTILSKNASKNFDPATGVLELFKYKFDPATQKLEPATSSKLCLALDNVKDVAELATRVGYHYYDGILAKLGSNKKVKAAAERLAEITKMAKGDRTEETDTEAEVLALILKEQQLLIAAYSALKPPLVELYNESTDRLECETDEFAKLLSSIHGERYTGGFTGIDSVMKALKGFYAQSIGANGAEKGEQNALRKELRETVNAIIKNSIGTLENDLYRKSTTPLNAGEIVKLIAVYYKSASVNVDGFVVDKFASAAEIKKFVLLKSVEKLQTRAHKAHLDQVAKAEAAAKADKAATKATTKATATTTKAPATKKVAVA